MKNLGSRYAPSISFVELLNVPTMGDSKDDQRKEFDRLLEQSRDHLQWLLQEISSGHFRRAVFTPDCVIKEMNRITVAPFFYQQISIRNEPLKTDCPKLIFCYKNVDVYKCYHFSDSRGRGQLEN